MAGITCFTWCNLFFPGYFQNNFRIILFINTLNFDRLFPYKLSLNLKWANTPIGILLFLFIFCIFTVIKILIKCNYINIETNITQV